MTDYSQNTGPFNRMLVAATAILLLLVYVYRLDFIPPRWEEPRRCIVAFEMIERGNFAVPTVYNEIYTKKPPLQNWLIALGAGFRTDRIDALIPRTLTVLSVVIVSLLLAWSARRSSLRWPWLAAAIYPTLGILVQYGRSGAIDPLFVLWTTSALVTFFIGVEKKKPWVAWFAPQLFVGLGILTKGLAPVFVYPPILIFAWRERLRPAWGATAAGLLLLAGIVGAWLVPFSLSGSLEALRSTGADEVLQRTAVGRGAADIALGLLRYPFEVLTNLLPWSLFVLPLFHPTTRRLVRDTYQEVRLFRFSLAAFAWTVLCLWLMPGSVGRYVMPAYPFFALGLAIVISRSKLRRRPHLAVDVLIALLAVAFVFYALDRYGAKQHIELTFPLLVGGLATLVALAARWADAPPTAARVLLFIGFLYALAFTSIHAPSRASWELNRQRDVYAWARQLAEHARARGLDPHTVPIGCSHGVNQAVCFELMKALNRSTTRPERNAPPAYAIGHVERSPIPDDRELMAEGYGLELWFVDAPSK